MRSQQFVEHFHKSRERLPRLAEASAVATRPGQCAPGNRDQGGP